MAAATGDLRLRCVHDHRHVPVRRADRPVLRRIAIRRFRTQADRRRRARLRRCRMPTVHGPLQRPDAAVRPIRARGFLRAVHERHLGVRDRLHLGAPSHLRHDHRKHGVPDRAYRGFAGHRVFRHRFHRLLAGVRCDGRDHACHDARPSLRARNGAQAHHLEKGR